jgi:hypothetical protein
MTVRKSAHRGADTWPMRSTPPRSTRGLLVRVVALALCAASGVAIVALLSGSFDETDGRLIGTSLGLGLFTATGAAGQALRPREGAEGALGALTVGASMLAFGLLVVAVWAATDHDEAWRAFGVLAVASLAGSHASVVLRGRRPDDTDVVRGLVAAALLFAAVDALGAALAIGGVVELDGDSARPSAVALVLLLLTSLLAPLLRRAGGGQRPARRKSPLAAPTLADEVVAAVERMEPLTDSPGLRRELTRLRDLARAAGR